MTYNVHHFAIVLFVKCRLKKKTANITLALLSTEVGGISVARETRDPSFFLTVVVTIDVIIVREAVTVGTLIPSSTLDSEPHGQSDPPIRSVSVVHLL